VLRVDHTKCAANHLIKPDPDKPVYVAELIKLDFKDKNKAPAISLIDLSEPRPKVLMSTYERSGKAAAQKKRLEGDISIIQHIEEMQSVAKGIQSFMSAMCKKYVLPK
jgi:hypothetical protein